MAWVPRSLHLRLLLSIGLGWLVLVAATLFFAFRSGSELIQQANISHLEYEATLISEQVERSLSSRIGALERLASNIAARTSEASPQTLQERLRDNSSLLALFDRLVIASAEGMITARYPYLEGLQGLDVSEREYFAFTRAVQRPFVSEPFVGGVSGVPVVMISVPLKDAEGRFAGLLGGVVRIESSSFFDRLRRIRIGEGGFSALVTASGTILSHPDGELVMQPVPDASTHPHLDLALTGWQGSGEGRLVDGRQALQAYAQVWPANWIVGVFLPLSQVQAPIGLLIRELWWAGVVTVLLMLPLLWWLLRLVLQPLQRFERQIARIGRGEATRISLRTRMRELLSLAGAFNRLEQQREAAAASLKDRQAFLDAVLTSSPVGMFVATPKGRVRFVNSALERLTGHGFDTYAVGDWTRHLHPEERQDFLDLWWDALRSGREFLRQCRYYRADGELLWIEMHASQVVDQGQVLGYVGTVKDITHRREQEALQRWEAEHDPLTGLLNRRGFERRMEEALAAWRKVEEPSVLMLFDLDHFKPINDQGGHALGDEMLRAIGEALTRVVRKNDHVARQGGDEFAVLMPSCSLDNATRVAQQLRECVGDIRVSSGGRSYQVTLSLGVTTFKVGDQSVEDVVHRADMASYRAKVEGRNRVVVGA